MIYILYNKIKFIYIKYITVYNIHKIYIQIIPYRNIL